MTEKNYVGSGWKNDKFDSINIKIKLAKLQEMPVDKYGDISLTVALMKQPNEKSKASHTVFENTFQKSSNAPY